MENKDNLKLDSVTVFQNSAMFKMQGKIECKKGENTVFLTNVTRFLDEKSLRVKGTGHGKIANIIIEKMYSDQIIQDKLKQLNDEKDQYEQDLKVIQDKIDLITNSQNLQQKAYETFVQEYPKWFSIGKIQIEAIDHLQSNFHSHLEELDKQKRENELSKKEILKKINELKYNIENLGGYRNRESNSYYQISVILEAEKASEFHLQVSFIVYQAHWEPFYEISIQDEQVNINFMANVHNHTEIDWEDVKLDISTASTTAVKMEKPSPYNIDSYSSVPLRPKRSLIQPTLNVMKELETVAQRRMDFAEIDEEMEEDMDIILPELTHTESNISSNFGVQVYNLPSRFKILSDKNPKPVYLHTESLKSVIQYFWSVSSPERVLCNNKIKNSDQLILPGAAKVYVGDEFIGETQLDLISPNQEFKLAERVSYDIKVKKELTSKVKSKEGAFKGKTKVEYAYIITIENLKHVSKELILYDRIPYSISEKIKVKLGDFSESPVLNEMHVIKFVCDMDKIEEKKGIKYAYEVVYEKDITIEPALP